MTGISASIDSRSASSYTLYDPKLDRLTESSDTELSASRSYPTCRVGRWSPSLFVKLLLCRYSPFYSFSLSVP